MMLLCLCAHTTTHTHSSGKLLIWVSFLMAFLSSKLLLFYVLESLPTQALSTQTFSQDNSLLLLEVSQRLLTYGSSISSMSRCLKCTHIKLILLFLVPPPAAGGLGHLATQYAVAMGLRVIGLDVGAEKLVSRLFLLLLM